MPSGQRFDRERRRRTGAEPDDHAVLDQFDRSLRRGALQRVAIAISTCAHDSDEPNMKRSIALAKPSSL